MTITDNGRVELDEETLARGRELTAGGRMPSKRELQKHLGKGWPVVNEVLTRLGSEAAERASAKRREARQKIRKLPGRKRFGSTLPARPERQRTVNEISPDTASAVAQVVTELYEPEAVQKRSEPVAGAVNETVARAPRRRVATWPIFLLTLPAFVAIWGGWVDLGRLTGFGTVYPFPGIPVLEDVDVDMAITLPIGLETYAAYALYVWLTLTTPGLARTFAMWSAIGSLVLGAAGQVAYHLMAAAGVTQAPWQITTIVACLPVAVLGMGAALRHLVKAEEVNE